MGMGREMIDWTKPIETTDGRSARPLTYVGARVVYVSPTSELGYGDVYLVNDEGLICGDWTNLGIRTKPFIRNAPVKREGWGRVNSNNGMPFTIGDIVFSEKASAEAACQKLGGIPAFITWEEEP